MTEKRLLSRRLIQVFNRYVETGGEETWVSTLEKSLGLPTCYFNSAAWVGAQAPSSWSQALRMIRNPEALRKTREFQRHEKAEAWIVHNVFPVGSAAIYRDAEKSGIPIIQYVHNFRPFSISGYLQPADLTSMDNWPRLFCTEIRHASWRKSRLRTAWFGTVLSIAHLLGWFKAITAWIAVSDFMRNQFIRAGIPSDKIFTLRHFWKPTADPGDTCDENFYLFIGRLIDLKGIPVLLNVWDRILATKSNASPKLVIIGEGPLGEGVRDRAKRNPLVDFRGAVSRHAKRELLRGTRALIVPSLCLESLGLVAYEAYDFAKPVLAARAGGLGEIVLDGRTGMVHEPGDVEALFDHIMMLEKESETRIRLGQNGREWLLENADEQRWRQKFSEIVEFAIRAKN